MKAGVFVWQLDRDYGIGTPQPDDRDLPISWAFVKALDGVTFMNQYDSSAAAIESPAGAARVAAVYAQRQIGMTPWGVHHGETTEGAQLEGARAGAVAAAVQGVYMLDLEDGPEYWRGGVAEVLAFLQSFEANGGRELWICADTREIHLGPEQFTHWWNAAISRRILPMVYWRDFQQTVKDAIASCLAPLYARQIPMNVVYPVFPADAPADELAEAVREITAAGCGGFALWRRGTLTAETIAYVAQLAGTAEAPPPIVTPPPPTTAPADPGVSVGEPGGLAAAYADGWADAVSTMREIPQHTPTNPYEGR